MKTNHFNSALKRFQRRWRIGLLLSGALRVLTWLGLALLSFGVLDFYSGFSDPVRNIIGRILGTVCALGSLHALWDVFGFGARVAASEADSSLQSPRREVLSALELQAGASVTVAGMESPAQRLSDWLRQRALDEAAKHLDGIGLKSAWPSRRLWLGSRRLLVVLLAFGLCFGFAPTASRIIAQRLLQPAADIPPYSPLRFSLGPQPAEVLYGGEILVSAEITGARWQEPVRCLTRDESGVVEESPAYQESPARFSRKLEKVAAPLEIAFAIGRARSAWMPVRVRTQPKIQDVVLTVAPPAYAGLPIREFAMGSQELTALPGSQVTARLRSNRPLSGGTLRLQEAPNLPGKEIAAEKLSTHEVQFTWTATQAGRLNLEVRDVLGTLSEPLALEQKLLRDGRPEVVLRQPASDVFATPETELPVEGSATDDLGLRRVTLVRQLKGYRERALAEPVSPGRRMEISKTLKLSPFGLVAGQTLELSLESADTNPNLLGVTVSEPARVHIISVQRYAEMLRAQTTLEEFSARYEALQASLEEARQTLEALEKAALSGDRVATERAREKALEATQKAAQVFGGIAKDFPIFDVDEALSKAALEAMKPLFENGQQLEGLELATPGEVLRSIPTLKKRLGQSAQQVAPELEKGERAAAAGKVFEEAAHFREVIEGQRALVKDLNRALEQIRRGESKAGQALSDLAARQSELSKNLREMEKELGTAIEALPEEFAELREGGQEFLEALRDLEIPPTMEEGANAGAKADGKVASDRASEALAKLEALLRKENGICEMCRGGELKFPWPQDLSSTLEQLLSALIPKPPGPGEGNGAKPGPNSGSEGFGPGGHSESGFSMRGKMPQLPVYGPSRARFAPRSGPLGLGEGSGGASRGVGANVESAPLSPSVAQPVAGEGVGIESVPEAYREAVKRYFSAPEPPREPAKSSPDRSLPVSK